MSPFSSIHEVHEIRWFSYYKAIETIYKTLDSLLTYMADATLSDVNATGLDKKMRTYKCLFTVHAMDILPILTELCLVFQNNIGYSFGRCMCQ